MRYSLFLALAAFVSIVSAQTPKHIGRIEKLDDAFDQLVGSDAKIEVLAGGFTWTEGPVWVADDRGGHLLFSDIPRNSIFRWSPAERENQSGGISLFLSPSGYTGTTYYGLEPGSNGLTLDPDGQLAMCEHGDRRVSVLTHGGGKRTLVDNYQGKRLNSPNDLVFSKDGSVYFTDPIYGLPERADDPRRELDFCGVYRLNKDGTLDLLTTQMTRPNGIGLSPDEKTLYVAQSDPGNPIWMSFPIQENGKLGAGKELLNARKYMREFPGLPDGLVVAKDGTLFASGPGGIYVMSPSGQLLGRLITGERTSNCTFDTDQTYLYLTADSYLCRVKMK
ncbi:SMP-30/gluconolactonase/LRE family protein [Stieleria varia]|uniref:Gluconolactonase n=1 Tax=Stieleria varia TaxID=2528005 RepID=A0A5C6B8G7_9BACT|nr:SMP-30/gluconolactonase/LRE family protein [Stieleria varia]TWU07731.1 Gluconolactonase precursor [Stieleria varia]